MSADDSDLAKMVSELVRLEASERDFVLRQLSAEEASRLAPYLEAPPIRPLSEALRSLGADCANERVPEGITPRAASAIEEAIAISVKETQANAHSVLAERPPSFRSMVTDFIAGR